jgi:hypothetical protein
MIDFQFSSELEENVDNPFATLYYGISTMHCMTISLAEGGAGLGTVCGEPRPHVACSPTPASPASRFSTRRGRRLHLHLPALTTDPVACMSKSPRDGRPLWHGMRADQRCPPTPQAPRPSSGDRSAF